MCGCVRLAKVNESREILWVEGEEAQHVRSRRLTRPQASRPVSEDAGKLGFNFRNHPAEVTRRPGHDEIDRAQTTPFFRWHVAE